MNDDHQHQEKYQSKVLRDVVQRTKTGVTGYELYGFQIYHLISPVVPAVYLFIQRTNRSNYLNQLAFAFVFRSKAFLVEKLFL